MADNTSDDTSDDTSDQETAHVAPAGSPSWLADPAVLMPLAVIAIIVFGGLHLLSDVIAFSGDFMGQLGGILTDSHTIVTGVAMTVGLTAVTRSPLPRAVASWRLLSWVAPARSDPARTMRSAVVTLIAIGAAQTAVAFWNRLDADDLMAALRLLMHDIAYVVTISGVVVTLAAVAVARSGSGGWEDAPRARELVTLALYTGPTLAVLSALLGLIDLVGDHARNAFVIASFLTIEAAAAVAILLLANVTVRACFPAGDGVSERIPLRGLAASAVNDPGRFIRPLVAVVIGVGILHVMLNTAEYGDYSSRLGMVGFADSLFDVVSLVAIVVVIRAIAAQGPLGLSDHDSNDPDDTDRTLARATYVIAYLGVFSALVSAWAYRGTGSEVWYWFFNRLVRTTIVLGALLGLQALRADRSTVEG